MRANFLIIGTQKGGTTALASFLASHPQVSMPVQKELHFFDYNPRYFSGVDEPSYERYSSMLSGRPDATALGEATPIYMYLPEIAGRLCKYNPNLKLICILRDPRDRAFSHYTMEVSRGNERLTFAEAIVVESERTNDDAFLDMAAGKRLYSYVDRGFYARQIRNLLNYFPKNQLLAIRNEDLANNHEGTMLQLYEFLSLAPTSPPKSERIFQQSYSELPREVRKNLSKTYSGDLDDLESLLGWRLDSWRE